MSFILQIELFLEMGSHLIVVIFIIIIIDSKKICEKRVVSSLTVIKMSSVFTILCLVYENMASYSFMLTCDLFYLSHSVIIGIFVLLILTIEIMIRIFIIPFSVISI